jgi:tetratricopeptide (TPR) repeat protein
MRLATRNWLAELGIEEPAIHAAIADHLLTFSTDDPIRVEEVVVHLLGAEDWDRTARYLGDSGLDMAGKIRARGVMIDMIRSTPKDAPARAANTLTRLLEVEGMDAADQSRVANHLMGVHYNTQGQYSLDSEEALLVPLEAYLGRLVSQEPGNLQYLHQRSVVLDWLGHLYKDRGDLGGSIECYRRAQDIKEQMADAESTNGGPRKRPVGSSLKLGDALLAKGDLDGALAIYSHPAHADSSSAHSRIGNVLRERNDLDGALASYSTGIEILKRELQEDPADELLQMNLGIGFSTIGTTLLIKREFGGALDFYRRAEKILAGLAARNPTEPSLQSEWSLMHLRIGQALEGMSDRQGARESLTRGIPILERVVAQHPDTPKYFYHLSLFHLPLGDLLISDRDVDGALAHWRAASKMLEGLVARYPENAEWRKVLDAALDRIDHAVRIARVVGEPAGRTPAGESGRAVDETTTGAARKDGWVRRTLSRWFPRH